MKKIWSMMVVTLAVVSFVALACAADTMKPAGAAMEEKKMDDKKMDTMKPEKKVKKAKKPKKEMKGEMKDGMMKK